MKPRQVLTYCANQFFEDVRKGTRVEATYNGGVRYELRLSIPSPAIIQGRGLRTHASLINKFYGTVRTTGPCKPGNGIDGKTDLAPVQVVRNHLSRMPSAEYSPDVQFL